MSGAPEPPATPVLVLPTPEAIGERVADRLLAGIERASGPGERFLLGCPTGRTPRPVYAAMARRLAARPLDLRGLVLVMMDEYLLPGDGGPVAVPRDAPWSCGRFAHAEIADALNGPLPPGRRMPESSVWLPDPRDPLGYDERIEAAGGVDFFLLASGASDGHVAFNPPGTPRESRTRVVALSEETRRDNLLTFPDFPSLDAVPRHGVSVGIATIAAAREAVMVVWGAGKRETLARILRARRYEPGWPATVIHECAVREIVCDREAAEAVRE